MVSTFVHATTQRSDHSQDGHKPIYTFHDSPRSLPPCEQPPASSSKESMDVSTHFSDPHQKRLLTNNARRLHTDLKGLWDSAPRSAHPAGTYERSVNYPRLFRLDSSYGLKLAPDFRLTTKATNAVPVKAFSHCQSSISLSNPGESARQVRSRAASFSKQFRWKAHMTPRG
jgi:hypothetical protein